MSKITITISKDFGTQKAKATMKEEVEAVIKEALIAKYGEEAVRNVRVLSADKSKGENLLGVNCADIEEDGGIFDGCLTIKLTAKEWVDRVGTKSVKPAWDFLDAADEYDSYVKTTTEKAAEKAKEKAAKIAADEAARAKRKAEAEAKKAAQQAEQQ